MQKFFFLFLFCALAASGAAGERPVNVESDEVQYSADGGEAAFRGNVRVTAGGLSATADLLRVQTVDGAQIYTARAAAAAPIDLRCTDCADYDVAMTIGEQLRYDAARQFMQITGGIQLCAGADCAQGEFSADTATLQDGVLTLTGAPRIDGTWQLDQADGAPARLQAAQITYDLASGQATLAGDPILSRAESEISGTRIRFNAKTGALSAEATDGQRARATFGQ